MPIATQRLLELWDGRTSAVSRKRLKWWAHKGSNLGPLPCEGNALPLSYAPGIFRARSEAARLSQIGKSMSPDAAIYEVRAISVKLGAMIAARRQAPKRYFVEADQRDLGRQFP